MENKAEIKEFLKENKNLINNKDWNGLTHVLYDVTGFQRYWFEPDDVLVLLQQANLLTPRVWDAIIDIRFDIMNEMIGKWLNQIDKGYITLKPDFYKWDENKFIDIMSRVLLPYRVLYRIEEEALIHLREILMDGYVFSQEQESE